MCGWSGHRERGPCRRGQRRCERFQARRRRGRWRCRGDRDRWTLCGCCRSNSRRRGCVRSRGGWGVGRRIAHRRDGHAGRLSRCTGITPAIHVAVVKHPAACPNQRLIPACGRSMEVLPVGARSQAVGGDGLRLVIQLADRLTHRAKLLGLILDTRPLYELKAGNLILDEAHTARQEPATGVLNQERGMMDVTGMRLVGEPQQTKEGCGAREWQPQPQPST